MVLRGLCIILAGLAYLCCPAKTHYTYTTSKTSKTSLTFKTFQDLQDLPRHPKPSIIHHLSVSLGADYLPSSIEDEMQTDIPHDERIFLHSALPVSLRYGFSFTNPEIRNYYPGGYQGISIGVLNIGALELHGFRTSTKYIGYPVLAYIYQGAPFWKNHKGLSLKYEWNFGAAIGWKPASEFNKYFNLTSGSRVNAYLHLNLSLGWQVNKNVELFAGVGVSHFSNGNTSYPNPGINAFGLRVGATYTLNPLKDDFPKAIADTVKKRKLEYDLLLWGASRKRVYKGGEEPVLLRGHFACAGLSFAPMVKLNTWWRVGGSADIQWDQSSDMKRNYIEGTTTEDIKFTTPNFFRQLTLGLSAHGELQMPIFALNVGVGYNIVAPWENRGSYQNISLKTYFCSKVFLNVGYQLRNFYQMGSLMLGLGLTL